MSIVLLGSTSGSCTLQEQAIAGTTTLTLPTFNGTVGLLVSGTAVASTSGTSIDFTGIPAGVRRITVMFSGVSTSGSSVLRVQLGTSSGITTSGYLGSASTIGGGGVANSTFSAGFDENTAGGSSASSIRFGSYSFSLLTSNTWVCTGIIGFSNDSRMNNIAGSVPLSATLDRIRITTVNGTDTFDAGSINIMYE